MSQSSKAKVAVVTGGSTGGIGYALARHLAQAGLRVFATARSPEKTGDLSDLGCTIIKMDVLDNKSVVSGIDEILEATGGRIDILVNNAGILKLDPFADAPIEDFELVIQTNLLGMARVARAVLPSMIRRESGLLVNIGSALSGLGQPGFSSYAASKAATRSWTESLQHELIPLGVHVMLIEPGIIGTHLNTPGESGLTWQPRPNSFYAHVEAMKSHLQKRASDPFKPENNPMDLDVFADKVVRKMLASSPPRYMCFGPYSTIWWFLELLPRGFRYWLERVVYGFRGDWRWSSMSRKLGKSA